jgi:hypothetical protein
MTIDASFGHSDYQYYRGGSIISLSSLSGAQTALVASDNVFVGDIICTFDDYYDRGYAYMVVKLSPTRIVVSANYVKNDRTGWDTGIVTPVTLPNGAGIPLGIYKTSKFTFRVLTFQSNVFYFYDVNLNAGTYTSGNSYIATTYNSGWTTWMYAIPGSRSGDIHYGLHFEDDGAITFKIYKWWADYSDGSFHDSSSAIYDAGGYIASPNAVVAQLAYLGPSSVYYNWWHDGDNGCNIKLAVSLATLDYGSYGGFNRWRINNIEAIVLTVSGTTFNTHTDVVDKTESFWLNVGENPSRSHTSAQLDISGRLTNSLYNRIQTESIISGVDSVIADSAYPYSHPTDLTPTDYSGSAIYTVAETDSVLTTYMFYYGTDGKHHMINAVDFTGEITFLQTGYNVIGIANQLDSFTGHIFCYAKNTTTNKYGLLEFDSGGTFVQWLPISSTGSGGPIYGCRIAENFVFVTTAITWNYIETLEIYYLPNDTYTPVITNNLLIAMIEMN